MQAENLQKVKDNIEYYVTQLCPPDSMEEYSSAWYADLWERQQQPESKLALKNLYAAAVSTDDEWIDENMQFTAGTIWPMMTFAQRNMIIGTENHAYDSNHTWVNVALAAADLYKNRPYRTPAFDHDLITHPRECEEHFDLWVVGSIAHREFNVVLKNLYPMLPLVWTDQIEMAAVATCPDTGPSLCVNPDVYCTEHMSEVFQGAPVTMVVCALYKAIADRLDSSDSYAQTGYDFAQSAIDRVYYIKNKPQIMSIIDRMRSTVHLLPEIDHAAMQTIDAAVRATREMAPHHTLTESLDELKNMASKSQTAKDAWDNMTDRQ